jgi:RNA polymerase sigma-70 factor (ECF subfamily)
MNDEARRAFGQMLEAHQGIVFKVARTYCRSREDRRDLEQEIVEQLWRSFRSYDPRRAFATWAYRVALNVAISFARKSSLRQRHTAPFELADEPLGEPFGGPFGEPFDDAQRDEDERIVVLKRLFAALEPLDRALLLLYLDEHSHREIAEILGITETNVATKVSRLKQRLRGDLASYPSLVSEAR